MAAEKNQRFSGLQRDSAQRGVRVPGRLEMEVRGVDVALLNGLRRAVLTDVPTAAFRFDASDPAAQDVAVLNNTGNLHNEFVGERVGLLPIHLTKEQLLAYSPAAWTFELDVTNDGIMPLDVTTGDFRIAPDGQAKQPDPKDLFPPDPLSGDRPLITVLMPKKNGVTQRLALEARSSMGTGQEHARFSPVSVCAFRPLQDPEAVKKERAKHEDKASFDALQARRIFKKDAAGNPEAFLFFLETQCGMTPEEIVESGLEALAARMRSLADGANGRISDARQQADSPADIQALRLDGETDTAGALIQMELLDAKITDFAGYFTPHQLQRAIVVRARVPPGKNIREMLSEACEGAAAKAEALLEEFREAAARVSRK